MTTERILSLLVRLPVLLFALSFHEMFHGLAAYFCGDSTAKKDGRLSMNPLAHIDPLGFLCMILFRFGWAKPVIVNPWQFRKPKIGMALTALAGPAANLLLSFVSLLLLAPVNLYTENWSAGARALLLQLFLESAYLNSALFVFNLLPFPPLDGSKVFSAFLPSDEYFRFINYRGVWTIVAFALLIGTDLASVILGPIVSALLIGMGKAAGWILG
ncbi:MAG: site-2 protease family protein [Clostridiales bacterium]|nr:site-2 protease family protein [Clostridiales bacterium]